MPKETDTLHDVIRGGNKIVAFIKSLFCKGADMEKKLKLLMPIISAKQCAKKRPNMS